MSEDIVTLEDLTAKQVVFVRSYVLACGSGADAIESAKAAARLAGYAFPEQNGPGIARRRRVASGIAWLERQEAGLGADEVMSSREMKIQLTKIARDPNEKTYNRMLAIRDFARMLAVERETGEDGRTCMERVDAAVKRCEAHGEADRAAQAERERDNG